MKNIAFVFILLCSFVAHTQVMWQVKNTTSKKWYLQTSEEFSEDGLNTNLWKSGLPWGNYL